MATVQLPPASDADLVSPQTRLRVLVKDSWAGEWEEHAYLQPLKCNSAVSPTPPRATFLYRYGSIKREDMSDFLPWPPAELADKYVRVMVMGADGEWPLWTGVFATEERQPNGAAEGASSGDQVLTAFGLESLLDRVPVDRGYVLQGADPAADDVALIGRAPVFNGSAGERGPQALGNRTKTVPAGGNGEHAFQADSDEYWTHQDVASYIVRNFSPAGIQFALGGQASALANLRTVIDPSGLTARQVLDLAIDRRRGVGWWLDANGEQPVVRVFTVVGEDVSAGGGEGESAIVLPANPDRSELDFSSDLLVAEPTIKRLEGQRFDRVIVRGARLRVTFTVSFADGNLEAFWTETEETAYKAAAGASEENYDAERSTDQFERVFCAWRIPRGWDWTAGNGFGSGVKRPVALTVRDDGSVDAETIANYWNDGRPLERFLVIQGQAGPTDGKVEFLKPMVFILSPEDNRYYPVDKISQPEDAGDDEVNDQKLDQPIPVRLLDRETGLLLKPKIPHVLGLNHFDADISPESETEPLYDYESAIATVCIATDEHLQVVEQISEAEQSENLKTLLIEVPDAEYWYVLAGTITGVSDGALVEQGVGEVKRNDARRLREIAAMARAWHGQARATATFSLRTVTARHQPGSYLSRLRSGADDQPLGTVVTQVSWDLSRPVMTTAVATGYQELDFSGLAGRPALDARGLARVLARLEARMGDHDKQLGSLPLREAQPGPLAVYGK